MTPEEIKARIESRIPYARLTVQGAEGKYEAHVVSPHFQGLNTVKRHQMVYAAVDDWIASGAIHALGIQARTPEEAG